jgi:hypothetical protein
MQNKKHEDARGRKVILGAKSDDFGPYPLNSTFSSKNYYIGIRALHPPLAKGAHHRPDYAVYCTRIESLRFAAINTPFEL